jgi:hypothetical protein
MVERDLQFGRVLETRSSEKRALLIVLPVVVVFALVVGFAVVAISRMSGLSTEAQLAQQQAEEAQKATDERDQKLREARAEAAILGSPGQGAAVLAAAVRDSGASGVAILHPETNAMNLYAYNLSPPPEGMDYRVIARAASGQEKDVAALSVDDRGGAFVLARDIPEGATHVEVALVPKKSEPGAQPNDQGAAMRPVRQTVLAGEFPLPGEAGVVAAASAQQGKASGRAAAQGRRGRR